MSTVATEAAPAAALKETTIAALKPQDAPEANLPQIAVGFASLAAFQLTWRVAGMFASSAIVPDRFRGNRENCAIAVDMAHRLRASPLMVMQNLYVVYGSPAWSAKFLIATFNQCGRFSSIRYMFQGTPGQDDWGCRAWAIELSTKERLEGPLITIKLAKDEGWYGRKDSKWKTMPEQMLRYRSGAWFINTTAPEISMGLPTDDEVRDIYHARRGDDGTFEVTTESLRQPEKYRVAGGADKPEGATLDNETGALISIEEGAGLIKLAETIGALEGVKSTLMLNMKEHKKEWPVEWDGAIGDRMESIKQLL